MSFPGLPVIRTPTPAPLEGQDMPWGAGVESNTLAATQGSLGVGLIGRATGRAEGAFVPSKNVLIPHDDAAKQMKDQGYDPSVLPSGDIHQGVLDAIMTVQSGVKRNEDIARRAHLGSTTSFVSGLVGGMADPLFLALGPIAGRVAQGARIAAEGSEGAIGAASGAGIVRRVVTGGAEGGAVLGGYTEAQKQFGIAPGDHDLTSYDVLRSLGYGAALGAGVKAVFGQRLTTGNVVQLEGSGANSVSPKGALGVHQIMPATAREYMGADFDVSTLKDPKVSEHVAQVILDDLQKRFPGDKEAQAVAYNAGPGEAEKWIKAGRNDAMLPGETQKYLTHLRSLTGEARVTDNPVEARASLPPDVKADAAKTAVAQASNDSEVNTDPVIRAGLTGQTDRLEEAVPKPGSVLTNERLSSDMLVRINDMQKQAAPKPTAAANANDSPELTLLKTQANEAAQDAEHAHKMAFGEEGKPAKEAIDKAMEEHAVSMLPEEDRLIHETEDLPKAIEAAVRCSLIKGSL